MPKTDMIKFKYKLNISFKIIMKSKTEIRIAIIFNETKNNVLE